MSGQSGELVTFFQAKLGGIIIKRPLLGLLACVLLGEIISIVAGIPLLILICGGAVFLIALLVHKKKLWKLYLVFPILIPIAFWRMEQISMDFPINSDIQSHIEGKVNKVVEKGDYVQVYLYNPVVDGSSLPGVIINYSGEKELMYGDFIACKAKLSKYDVARNPGNFDTRLYYESVNIVARGSNDELIVLEKNNNPWIRAIFALKKQLIDTYKKISTGTDAGVYISLVLGDKALLDAGIKELYQVNGMAHILAISGLHVSILGMGLYKFLRKCLFPFLPAFVVSFGFIISYGLMTGNSISTIRAIVMFLISIFAAVIGKSYDMASAMGIAAIALILIYPKIIYNTGFWLSFLAVTGIMIIKPALDIGFGNERAKHNDSKKVKLLKMCLDGFLSSLAVNIATIPVLLYSYFELPIYSVFLNMLIIPLMSFLMVSVVLGGVLGLFSLPAGAFCIGMAHYILVFYENVCEFFMKLPFAVVVFGQPALWQIILYYVIVAAMICIIYYVYVREEKIIKPVNAMVAGIVLSLVLIIIRFRPEFRLRMLDVGQGDGIHVSCDGVNMLVDGGSTSVNQVGEYRLIPYLKSQAVTKIDYMVVSHGDLDHISGLLEILADAQFEVKYLIMPEISGGGEGYENMLKAAALAGAKVEYICAGEEFLCGNAGVKCLHPVSGYSFESTNDYSTVLQLVYGELDILLTGDVEDSGEDTMLSYGRLKDVEILKVAHHGSRYSTDEEFLNAVLPELALISCGAGNSYGHPHAELMERLAAVGSTVYTTKDCGAITVEVGERISVYGYLEDE